MAAIQVEHPVTEWISGVNIPSCQLMIGMGVPLHRIPDIRRLYGLEPNGDSPIDFDNDPQIAPSGMHLLYFVVVEVLTPEIVNPLVETMLQLKCHIVASGS